MIKLKHLLTEIVTSSEFEKALKQAKKMCEELLVNTIIENYQINILGD